MNANQGEKKSKMKMEKKTQSTTELNVEAVQPESSRPKRKIEHTPDKERDEKKTYTQEELTGNEEEKALNGGKQEAITNKGLHQKAEHGSEPIFMDNDDVTEDTTTGQNSTTGKWTTMEYRNHQKKSHKKPKFEVNMEKLKRTLYMTAVDEDHNFAKDAGYTRSKKFKEEIQSKVGDVESMTTTANSIRIVCKDENQVATLLKVDEIIKIRISTTIPNILYKESNKQNKYDDDNSHTSSKTWNKCVIKRVPTFVTEEQIQEDSEAIWVHRVKATRNGKLTDTMTVILAFTEHIPEEVCIGLNTFHTEQYIPKPIRCGHCQKYGHRTTKCRQKDDICPKCSKNHPYEKCTVTEYKDLKCPNCGDNHNAAYKRCRKYKDVNKTLVLSTRSNITYAEAAKKLAIADREGKGKASHNTKDTLIQRNNELEFPPLEKSTQNDIKSYSNTGKYPNKRLTLNDMSTQTDSVDTMTQTEETFQTGKPETGSTMEYWSNFQPVLIALKHIISTIPATDRTANSRYKALQQLQLLEDSLTKEGNPKTMTSTFSTENITQMEEEWGTYRN